MRNKFLDVDECSFAPQPCVNFGTCVNTPGYYDCLCINGTEGHDCQISEKMIFDLPLLQFSRSG